MSDCRCDCVNCVTGNHDGCYYEPSVCHLKGKRVSELRWNGPFIEVEENASGWFWRLRLQDHTCIARSPHDYPTFEALKADIEQVPDAIRKALTVQPLKSKAIIAAKEKV